MKALSVALLVLVSLIGCGARNNAVCCTDHADCTAIGLADGSRCEPGFSCGGNHACEKSECTVDSECPADRSHCTDGVCIGCDAAHTCMSNAPVCAADMTCSACATNDDCAAFPDQPVCDPSGSCRAPCMIDTNCPTNLPHCDGGFCVECDGPHPCAAGAPVCALDTTCQACQTGSDCAAFPGTVCGNDGGCRACVQNSECDSQVCDSGACLAGGILYLSPTGGDAGACTQAAPCLSVKYALSKAHTGKQYLVMAFGEYRSAKEIVLDTTTTATTSLIVLGNGATISGGDQDPNLTKAVLKHGQGIALALHDLVFTRYASGLSPLGVSLSGDKPVTLDHVRLFDSGLSFLSSSTINDLQTNNVNIVFTGTVTINGALIENGYLGDDIGAIHLTATNMSIHSNLNTALSLSHSTVDLSFSSVYLSGTSMGQTALVCGGGTVASSILWVASASAAPVNGICSIATSIVGPTKVGILDNRDPLFTDAKNHIGSTSPARDAVACGASVSDFEGDPRPQGVKCDIGADEYKP